MTSSYSIEIDVEEAAKLRSKLDSVEADSNVSVSPSPGAIVISDKKHQQRIAMWLDEWINELEEQLQTKNQEWADEESAYNAESLGPLQEPFVGASGDQVALIAMAVDPIVARLDTGIFKIEPVFRFKPLQKSAKPFVDPLERWVQYYQKHQLKLRTEVQPRLIELAKHGSMVLKVVYDCVQETTKGYDKSWNVIDTTHTVFKGPRIVGVPLSRFLFPQHFPNLQACPIVGERIRLTREQLIQGVADGKFANIDAILNDQTRYTPDPLEAEQDESMGVTNTGHVSRFVEDLYEVWFDYADTTTKSTTNKFCAVYHKPTQTFIQLRYNWYFHRRKPYVIIPYAPATGSLYGFGIAKMVKPIQDTLTQWHRHALNNAYLANIRMFVVQKDAKIEQKPKLFTGRVFHVEDPSKDFVPMNGAADIYPSTLAERNNLIGIAEKRTGVSDYLVGRESPIVGSRATATSTLALIQEGTRRVDAVTENIRIGMNELFTMVIDLWIQYGVGDIDDIIFDDDEVKNKLNEFFNSLTNKHIGGMLSLELAATDATNSKTAQQQAQLAIIQTMMVYLEKSIQAAQLVAQTSQSSPQLATFLGEIMDSARTMYVELLTKYEIKDPEAYLPDLEQFLSRLGIGGANNPSQEFRGSPGEPDLSTLNPQAQPQQGIQGPQLVS